MDHSTQGIGTKIGELRDPLLAKKIVNDLNQNNIRASLDYAFIENETTGIREEIIQVRISDETKSLEALDIFRVHLGFPKALEIDPEWQVIKSLPTGIVTKFLMIVSVCLYILLQFIDEYNKIAVYEFLSFSTYQSTNGLEQISQGEIWRLFTPIFLHFNIMHILFNVFCMKDFGKTLEHFWGLSKFIVITLIFALATNLSQYLVHGPRFGGLSGIIYAYLGYLWCIKELTPDFKYGIPKSDSIMMIVWFFLCLTGLIGNIANTAHAVGFTSGIIWAIGESFKKTESTKSNNNTCNKLALKRLAFFSFSLGIIGLTLYVELYVK